MSMTTAGLKRAGKRAVRTFVVAVLVLFIPGVLGWLADLMDWANSQGKTGFPDPHALAYLAVAALIGGVIAVLNFALNLLETDGEDE